MNLSSVGMICASAVVGLSGAGVAYQLNAVDTEESQPAPPAAASQQAQARTEPRVRWAPCEPPAVPKGDECVVDVVRTVTLPAPAAKPADAAPAPAVAPAAAAARAAIPAAPAATSQVSGQLHGEHDAEEAEDDREDAHDELEDAAEDRADEREDRRDDRRDAAEDGADEDD